MSRAHRLEPGIPLRRGSDPDDLRHRALARRRPAPPAGDALRARPGRLHGPGHLLASRGTPHRSAAGQDRRAHARAAGAGTRAHLQPALRAGAAGHPGRRVPDTVGSGPAGLAQPVQHHGQHLRRRRPSLRQGRDAGQQRPEHAGVVLPVLPRRHGAAAAAAHRRDPRRPGAPLLAGVLAGLRDRPRRLRPLLHALVAGRSDGHQRRPAHRHLGVPADHRRPRVAGPLLRPDRAGRGVHRRPRPRRRRAGRVPPERQPGLQGLGRQHLRHHQQRPPERLLQRLDLPGLAPSGRPLPAT